MTGRIDTGKKQRISGCSSVQSNGMTGNLGQGTGGQGTGGRELELGTEN